MKDISIRVYLWGFAKQFRGSVKIILFNSVYYVLNGTFKLFLYSPRGNKLILFLNNYNLAL